MEDKGPNFPILPDRILNELRPESLHLKTQGRAGDSIYYGQLRSNERVYLKVGSGYAGKELCREAERLEWLSGNPIAPQLIDHWEVDGRTHLLILEIEGKAIHLSALPELQIVAILSTALRAVHGLKMESCPFRNTLSYELEEIERFSLDGRIDVSLFSKSNRGKTPEEVLKDLHNIKGRLREDTVTHGDFCLPNIIVGETELSGIVDWSKCGVSDRHRDFSALEGSIKRNLGPKYVPEFYTAYGIGARDVDPELIRFYQLIDQFHYYRVR